MQRPNLADLIRSTPRDADSERADWTGQTARAKFQGARQSDAARKIFGTRNR